MFIFAWLIRRFAYRGIAVLLTWLVLLTLLKPALILISATYDLAGIVGATLVILVLMMIWAVVLFGTIAYFAVSSGRAVAEWLQDGDDRHTD